ncbi:hypothetical protein NC653_013605 [Populus alba x Populus x berolinensis]|uniref:Uncharacterized protein n=1 Tax=Populus alba x Populus x berolinensis TaxID=444605 RepID=A0AAD6W2U6_9ROSI|nr:hypothetical protein NC653_013605 [Populus alba x Populus x berolinensis]
MCILALSWKVPFYSPQVHTIPHPSLSTISCTTDLSPTHAYPTSNYISSSFSLLAFLFSSPCFFSDFSIHHGTSTATTPKPTTTK